MRLVSDILAEAGLRFSLHTEGPELACSEVSTWERAVPGSVVFVSNDIAETSHADESHAAVLVVAADWVSSHSECLARSRATIISVESPREAMAVTLARLYPDEASVAHGVAQSAIIDRGAHIHPSVTVGHASVIGRVSIGEGSQIGAFCVIHDGVEIGRRVIIREYCNIGGAGFGYVRHSTGELTRIPHIGGVRIEDDVELFPYVNIDRGTLRDTVIGSGTKIDHYCHIGHNSRIGRHVLVTAGTVTCGSSTIHDRAWVGVGSIIKQGVTVGSDSTIGLGSVVLKDVESGVVVAGVPARPLQKNPSP